MMNAQSLDEFRWKKRVVIIYAPAGTEKKLAEQKALLRDRDGEARERDLTQIVLRNPSDHPEIARRFKLTTSGFTVLLIGKDGGEKLRSAEITQPGALFRLIDSLPMRQQEARARTR